jgi:hypothetical protein
MKFFNFGALRVWTLIFLFSAAYSTPATAIDDSQRLIQVLSELDRLESKLKDDADRLEEKVNHNEAKLRDNEKAYSEILELQRESKSVLTEANNYLSELKTLKADIQDARERLAKNETKSNNIETQLAETKTDVRSSGNVIKWVTAIVSVIVIIVGLFFSKVFLDLYANYKVLASRLEPHHSDRNSQHTHAADAQETRAADA